MNKQLIPLNFFLTLSFLLGSLSLCQAQIYVDLDATSGSNNGSSWTDAYTDLQAAINATASGDIWVAEGSYKPDLASPGDRALSFSLKNGVAIYGGFDATETLLSERDPAINVTIMSGDIGTIGDNSDNSYHVVDNSANSLDATAEINGFTISDGNADGMSTLFENIGAGMYNNSSSPTVTNCTFTNNTAQSGGGMANLGSSPLLTDCIFTTNTVIGNGAGMANNSSVPILNNCTFSDNTAGIEGGGIFNFFNSNSMIINCTFSTNSATRGGGVFNDNCNPTLTDCTFSNNSASNGNGGGMCNQTSSNPEISNCTFSNNSAVFGGGMFNSGGNPELTNCTFSNNSATRGGGMYNIGGNPELTNCTFSNNSTSFGGGMFNSGSNPDLTSCTFSNNSATNNGGGMFNTFSSPTLTNCIIWGNGSSFNDNSATIDYSIVEGATVYAGTGNLNSDPLFVNAADPDGPDNIPGTADDGIAISSSSPGAGTGNSCPATDITGATRTMCDMGAYVAIPAATQAFKIVTETETYPTLQAAITALSNTAGEIEQLLDFTEATLAMIPSYVTLVIPANKTLTFNNNNISSGGIISNNGTLVVGTFTNSGTYKGNGTCQGNFVNNGIIQIGGD